MSHHLAPIVSDTPHAVCNIPYVSHTHTCSNCGVDGVMIDPCDYCQMLPQCCTCRRQVYPRSASKMTYIVSGGALNSTHSLVYPRHAKANTCEERHVLFYQVFSFTNVYDIMLEQTVTNRTQVVTSYFLAFHVVAARGWPGGALGAAGEAQARESWFCAAVEDGCV